MGPREFCSEWNGAIVYALARTLELFKSFVIGAYLEIYQEKFC